MRVIIISDSDARALLEQLELEKLRDRNIFVARAAQQSKMSESERKTVIDEMHRAFHYIVTRWLQEQGASITR